jgi:regulator of sigma E protease
LDDTRQPVENVKPEPTPSAPTGPISNWLRQNFVQLAVIATVITVVCRYLYPIDVLLAGVGLSFIVFIHELGHFAAAKLCDVRVTTFSIGFGPALPFCSFQYGETKYKIALIPLGGYVAMSGETTGEIEEDPADVSSADGEPIAEENDPRNFKNKPVWQRMIIISAGVIMNVILGAACFIGAYANGVNETPPVLGGIEPGSAAWVGGLRPGTQITSLNGRTDQWFEDIRPTVSSTSKGEKLKIDVTYQGQPDTVMLEPRKPAGAKFPTLGILPNQSVKLAYRPRDGNPPYDPQSPASKAVSSTGERFQTGDRIIGMSDISDPKKITPFNSSALKLPNDHLEYLYRMDRLAGQPVLFQVVRRLDKSETPITLEMPPMYRQDLGITFRMGPIVAVRDGSPAAKAGIQIRQVDGENEVKPGDEIIAVELVEADGKFTRFTTDKAENLPANPKRTVKPLDPIRLPFELDRWADRQVTPSKVKLTLLRDQSGDHTRQRIDLELDWDASYRFSATQMFSPSTPMPLNCLGLAYRVQAIVHDVAEKSPAAEAGLQPNDQITEVRFKGVNHEGEEKWGNWSPVDVNHAVFFDFVLQSQSPHQVEVRLKRDERVVSLSAKPDMTWPVSSAGLDFENEKTLVVATSVSEALSMGMNRVSRSVRQIYQGLYGMVTGRISVQMMSGPISMARISYIFAGRSFWELVLWLGLISINLAIVNFLPIPVLDGGHMIFLLYEGIRGKPAPESVHIWLSYGGLAMVLSLMLFVIGLDIWRLIFW